MVNAYDKIVVGNVAKYFEGSLLLDNIGHEAAEDVHDDGQHQEGKGFWAKVGSAFSGFKFGFAIGGTLLIGAAIVAIILILK